ncbi:DUF1963 domain-containing protein [Streptomyces justiciae]|uniref:DUF1963 domain-containing protein n=1 Tax=Streptomyces justiciae TaxID=2780140 RepID=UPI002117B436|nr:DUF1963 domain-containing protein [Streptomyces justiciae]MCW8382615.1 YwqG family protein [Streptomyces justiciae]
MTDASMINRFRAEAALRGLPSQEVEEWIRVARPAVYLAEGGNGLLVARVGGDPLLPHGAPRPSDPFVASVDLAALRPGVTGLPLPADGHLLLCSGTDVSGIGGEVPTRCCTSPPGPRQPLAPSHTVGANRTGRASSARSGTSRAHRCRRASPSAGGEFPEDEQFELADELADAWAHVGGYRPSWALQIGGHPVSPQNDPVHYARGPEEAGHAGQGGTAHGEGADDWVLLATWRCGDDVTELDSGVAHWVIRRRDVAVRRFDRAHRYVEMA